MLAKEKLPSEVHQSSSQSDKKSLEIEYFFLRRNELLRKKKMLSFLKLEACQILRLVSWVLVEGMVSIKEDIFFS